MNDFKSEVCGVVILYNPAIAVLENIKSYVDQVDKLVVIDNSEDEDDEIIRKLQTLPSIQYKKTEQNIGVAKALNTAVDIAVAEGYKYLLTMDQDSIAPANMVKKLVDVSKEYHNVGIVSPLHSNKYDTHLRNTKEIEKVNVVMTSGNIISLDVCSKVGKFCEEYFIDYVDIEYCFRLQANNYDVYRLNKIILEHDEADLSIKRIFGKTFYPHNHKPFRFYYKTRNLLYLRKNYRKIFSGLLKIEYDSYLRTVGKMLLFEKQKLLKTKMILAGIWDYTKGITNGIFFE